MNPYRASLSRQPLAQLAVAFSAGILAANYFNIGSGAWSIVGAVCTAATLVLVIRQRLRVASLALLLATTCAGATFEIQQQRNKRHDGLRPFLGQQVILTGILHGPIDVGRDRMYLTLNVECFDVNESERGVSGTVSLLAPFRSANSEQEYRSLQLRY